MNFDKSRYEQVFKRLGYTNEVGATLLLRTQLLVSIKNEIERHGWTQVQAAKALGIKQPRISEIYSLQINKFSLELLVKYLFRLKHTVEMNVQTSEPAQAQEVLTKII